MAAMRSAGRNGGDEDGPSRGNRHQPQKKRARWRGEQIAGRRVFQRKFATAYHDARLVVEQTFLRKTYKDPITNEDSCVDTGSVKQGQSATPVRADARDSRGGALCHRRKPLEWACAAIHRTADRVAWELPATEVPRPAHHRVTARSQDL